MNKLYIVKNVDGSGKVFKNIPALMTQEKINRLSDREHPYSNVPTYYNPVWVDYSALENTLFPGYDISADIIDILGIDYNNMNFKTVYEIEVGIN